ncbi:hypothetical protein GCK72_016982 [Caenorhabditis remanei]|uniref:UPAR/Ly6 domain-containing protein n=1 Tax=Caenorhabditis remanei TaxID=31234 RepID=A0A6A5G6V9_CAERE|nr:hypothetical protein GCK72_016982 [Caenorhabditis remanei]KAF1750432.1 hypothetical protein GCK72_016982 [Caenorhabditis remanei]
MVTNSDALKCYDTSMQEHLCEPIQLFCIKFINGSTVTRGCAGVDVYCTDEDPGCYPTQEVDGLTQKWCCCEKDMCNESVSTSLSICTLIFSLIFFFISLYYN